MPTCSGSIPLTPWTPRTQAPRAALAPQHLATRRRLSRSRQSPRSLSPTSGSATLAPPLMDRQRQAQAQAQAQHQHQRRRHPLFLQQVAAHGLPQKRFRSVETPQHTARPVPTIACSAMVIGFTRTRQPRRRRQHRRRRHPPAHQVAQVDR